MQYINTIRMPRRPSAITLTDDLCLSDSYNTWIVPRGTRVVSHETTNFGWVFLPAGTRDIRGFVIPKRIFRY